MNVLETSDLGKRYRDTWALRECTFTLPAGHLAALVGPNGAGKTTLMNMSAGLAVPTTGTATVLAAGPRVAGRAGRRGVRRPGCAGVPEPVRGGHAAPDPEPEPALRPALCPGAAGRARHFAEEEGRQLSGGQQAQLALTLALARRPELLILDEPLAALDPLARQDFLATVLTAMADDGVSVLLSSHALADLERVADYLVVLSGGRLQVAGEVDDLLACHHVLTGPVAEADACAAPFRVVQDRRAGAQAHLLVRTGEPGDVPGRPGWETHPVSLEELVMAYLRAPQPAHSLQLAEPTEATR